MASRSKGVVIPISAEDNSARAFDSVNAQVARLREQVAMLRAQSSGASGSMIAEGKEAADVWHNQTTEVQATSAAIRTLDGNPGIRAVERFLVTIPGVGTALLAAFPVIGAIAFAGVLERGIEKIIEMKNAAAQLAAAITSAFDEAIAKERQQADELALSNDRLDAEIAKLEHRPSNGLVQGIDEARIEADKLGDSMHNALKEAESLFNEKFKVGFFDHLLNNTQSTDPVKKEVLDTLEAVEKVKTEYAGVIQGAADSGNSKEHIDELNQLMLGHVEDIYAASTKKLQGQLKAALNAQTTDEHIGGTGKSYDPLINSLRGSLGLYDQQQRVIGEQYRQSSLAPQVAVDKGDKPPKAPGADRGAEEYAKRIAEAEQRVSDAQTKAAEQAAQGQADAAKRRADVALAQLEDQHKKQLISDQDYYKQKAQIQVAALDQEAAANNAKQAALGDEVRGTVVKFGKDKGDAPAQLGDAAKITELQTQTNELEEKRADIVERRGKLEAEADASAFEAAKKQTAEAEKLAAAVETIRGGSTSARTAQSDAEYTRQRKDMVVQGASPAELGNFDYQHQTQDADIELRGAQDTENNAESGFATQRNAAKYKEASGQASAIQTRQTLIDLDQKEAAALQPVLEAYEKLAALNVDGATEKVAELKEKIAELQQPVSEVSSEIRNQFDSAFGTLFENLDKGKKAWLDFGKALQSDVLKDSYKQFVEPVIQRGMGLLVPHGSGTANAPGAPGGIGSAAPSGVGAAAKAALSLIPGMPAVPGVTAGAKGGGGTTVQIINQSSTPVQGTQASQQSDLTEALRPSVIQIVLEDMDRNGSIGQALSGLSSGLLA